MFAGGYGEKLESVLKNPSAAIWSVMWKWELSCPAVWIRVYCRVVRGKNGVYGGISGWEQRLQRGKQGQEVARYAHLSYHMHTIGKKEFWDVLPKVMYALDEPSGDASAVAMYFWLPRRLVM